jgi:phosphatidylinositol glycan class B
VQANVVEGAAAVFGAEPPLAYAWMLPANLFLPVIVVLLLLAVLAWARNPRHPVTWATLPFFVVHNLVSHKEERFLFPMAILATALPAMALGPSAERPGRAGRVVAWCRRRRGLGWALAAWSAAGMVVLATWPIGWHHHVRFQRHVHDALGGDLVAYALPDFDLGLPAFHGRVYDVQKASPEEIARRLDEGGPGGRVWLVADTPRLRSGLPSLDARATLVWSELPMWDRPVGARILALAEAYDARARPPLRPLRFRSLYRLAPPPAAK